MADAAVSPLARAIRFGTAIRQLRERAGLSQGALADQAEISRTALSRIETPDPGRRADPHHMRAALRVLLVDEDASEYRELERLIWDATAHGWWEGRRGMGDGQRVVAAIECGAARIRELQLALIPGLAQTPEYARYRAEAAPMAAVDTGAMVDGRLQRQRQVAAAGTQYELIITEQALHWLTAPADVMTAQLDHLLTLSEQPHVTIRVLPVKARLAAGWAPTSPYSIYEYPDLGDPVVVLTDVVGQTPVPISDPDATLLYVQLHERLAGAALSDVDSAALIKHAGAWLGDR